jgi:hypothetical protein
MSTRKPVIEAGAVPRRGTRALGVVGATAGALVVWALAYLAAGVDLVVRMGDSVEPIYPAAIIIVSVVAGAAGWVLLAVLERFTRRARAVWTVVAVAVLVLSLGLVAFAESTGAMVTLLSMHLVVGVVLILTLARTARPAAVLVGDQEIATPAGPVPPLP